MKPDWNKLNFDAILDECEELAHYLYVYDDLIDIGIECREINDNINRSLIHLKELLGEVET